MNDVIAIDGPAGAGKSTIARRVARQLGYTYIDTGAMYRAIALWAIRTGIRPDEATRLEQLATAADIQLDAERRVFLNGEEITEAIRTPEVSGLASQVAAVGGVRTALVLKQRAIAASRGVVMEGRDIGTVVFPHARVKIFLDAQPHERVNRRAAEQPGVDTTQLAAQIAERDARDRGRTESPLVQAPDAVYVDSTGLTLEQVEEKILGIIKTSK
jgi:cytidylate kinase